MHTFWMVLIWVAFGFCAEWYSVRSSGIASASAWERPRKGAGRMTASSDLTGAVFGWLTVVKRAGTVPNGPAHRAHGCVAAGAASIKQCLVNRLSPGKLLLRLQGNTAYRGAKAQGGILHAASRTNLAEIEDLDF